MNRYNHIPEGCVTRKAFSQTCWPEVQSERYRIFLMVQQRQITCYVICFSGKLVHSETLVKLLSTTTALLCISPSHGRVHYTWEKNVFSAWEKMDLPPHTCLLFVERRGTYRCSVGDDTVTFKVIGMQINSWLTTWFLYILSILLTLLPSKEPTLESTTMCHKENTSKLIL